MDRLVIGITGASGAIYGIRLLQELKTKSLETHLVVSRAAEKILKQEENVDLKTLETMVTRRYEIDDVLAPIASGSFLTEGMVVIPCSMKTLAGIACGYSDNLLLRAAAVCVKEGRRLVLVPRETPLSPVDLENMLKLARIGVAILPAMPAFYNRPQGVDDMVSYVIGKTLDVLRIEHDLFRRWS